MNARPLRRILSDDRVQVCLAATLGWLCLYGGSLLPGRWPLPASWTADPVTQFFSWNAYLRECLADGVLPLWNPHNGLGQPFLANGQAAVFYPVSWLRAALPDGFGLMLALWLKAVLAALFTHLFLRRLKIGLAAAAAGGVAFAFLPHFIAWNLWPQTSSEMWIPLVLCLATAYADEGRARHGWWLALALALQLFAGQPQTWALTLPLAAAWFLWRRWDRRDLRGTLTALGKFLSFCLAGAALGAIQLLPFLEYLRGSYAFALRSRINPSLTPPGHLLHQLVPAFFGDTVTGNHWAWTGEMNYYLYAGIPVLLLALLAAFRREHRRETFFWLALAAGFWLLFFRWPARFWNAVLDATPLGSVGFVKLIIFYNLGLIVPAARALDGWAWARDRRRLGLLASSLSAAALAGLWFYSDFIRALDLSGYLAWQYAAFFLVLGGTVLALWKWNPSRRGLAFALLLAVVFADLWHAGRIFVYSAPAEGLFPGRAELRDFVRQTPDPPRAMGPDLPPEVNLVYGVDGIDGYDAMTPIRTWRLLAWLEPPGSRLYRVEEPDAASLRRVDSGTLARRQLKRLFEIYGRARLAEVLDAPGNARVQAVGDPDLAALARLGWEVRRRGNEKPEGTPVFEGKDWLVYPLGPVEDRAAFYTRVRFRPWSVEDRLTWRQAPPFDRRLPCIAGEADRAERGEGAPAEIALENSAAGPVPGAVRRAEYGRGHVRLEVEAVAPGWLVLRDLYFPDWEALVDGQPAEVRVADTAFRAVPLAAGRHEILFLYRPDSFKIGLVLSFLAALVVAIGWLKGGVGKRPGRFIGRAGREGPAAGSPPS